LECYRSLRHLDLTTIADIAPPMNAAEWQQQPISPSQLTCENDAGR
jgi:hypothetical protein